MKPGEITIYFGIANQYYPVLYIKKSAKYYSCCCQYYVPNILNQNISATMVIEWIKEETVVPLYLSL